MIIGRPFSTSTVKTDLKKVSSKLSWSYALSWTIHYYFILSHFWNVFSLEHPRGVAYIRYLRIRISKAVTIILPVERISLQPQRTILYSPKITLFWGTRDTEVDLGLLQTSQMEVFVKIVHGYQPLISIVTTSSILDVAAVSDPPLGWYLL